MDGQQVEGGQYKSIPAFPTVSGFCNLKSKIIFKNNNNKQKFSDLFSFFVPRVLTYTKWPPVKKNKNKKNLNQSETVVVMLLGLIAQSMQLASLRLGFLLAF